MLFYLLQINRTALHLAALSGNVNIYKRLLELGLDPRSVDQKGKTAEHYLRTNASISSSELQDLLTMGSTVVNNASQVGTRLTKLSKAPSKNNVNSTAEQPATNGNSGTMKISSKPVRLPALSHPGGGAKATDSKSEQLEEEEINKPEVDKVELNKTEKIGDDYEQKDDGGKSTEVAT